MVNVCTCIATSVLFVAGRFIVYIVTLFLYAILRRKRNCKYDMKPGIGNH
jgi:hypothetical protein